MWDLPRQGLEPVSAALAGRFSTTAPPGKPNAASLIQTHAGTHQPIRTHTYIHKISSGNPVLTLPPTPPSYLTLKCYCLGSKETSTAWLLELSFAHNYHGLKCNSLSKTLTRFAFLAFYLPSSFPPPPELLQIGPHPSFQP